MNQRFDDEGPFRRYLLGQLAESDQENIECQLLSEQEMVERLLIVEDELIESYVSGELAEADRPRFEQFFLVSPERQHKLKLAKALNKYANNRLSLAAQSGKEPIPQNGPSQVSEQPEPARWWTWFAVRPVWQSAVATLLVLGLGFGLWRSFSRATENRAGSEALVAAYREERPLASRIAGFEYAPYVQRRGTEDEKFDQLKRRRAERILLDEVDQHRSSNSLHGLGQFYLADKNFPEAIKYFEAALALGSPKAQLHNDLGVALLEKAKAKTAVVTPGQSLEEANQALEHFTKALDLDPAFLEARFNRALCNQYLSLTEPALADWKNYLERDTTSRWADEARYQRGLLEEQQKKTGKYRQHLEADFLAAYQAHDDEKAWQVLRQSRPSTSSFIAEKLLDQHLALATQPEQNPAASQSIEMLAYAGKLDRIRAGDHFLAELAQLYQQATPAKRQALAQGRDLMQEGQSLTRDSRYAEALEKFTQAQTLFDRAGDRAESRLAELRRARCYVRQSNLPQSLALLTPLLHASEKLQYKWLRTRALQTMAETQVALNQYSKALASNQQALQLAEETNDPVARFDLLIDLGNKYKFLGKSHTAMGYIETAWPLARDNLVEPQLLRRFYTEAALNLTELGLNRAAFNYLQEALQLAVTQGNPAVINRTYAQLGLSYGKLQNYQEAIKKGQLSLEAGKTLAAQSAGREMMAFAALQLGYLYYQSGDLAQALPNYEQAITLYQQLNNPFFLYLAHRGKLFTLLARNDDAQVKAVLPLVLALHEQHRATIQEESNRNSFFDAGQNVYDAAIDFEASRLHDDRRAFEYSETSRARSLLDLINTPTRVVNAPDKLDLKHSAVSSELDLKAIQRQLPPQVQILQYAVLKDKLLMWVVSQSDFFSASMSIDAESLRNQIQDYWKAASSPAEEKGKEAERLARTLYEHVIKPVVDKLDSSKTLCIVPDKSLHYLPFGALSSATSGKFLIEDFCLLFSPSSSIFIANTENARRKSAQSTEQLLTVGNPLLSRNALTAFPPLPAAAQEAEAIGRYYRTPQRLIGAQATERTIRQQMPLANVLHFAVHAMNDARSPMNSKLMLAEEVGTASNKEEFDGTLQAHEIYRLKLPQARLVVLSACQTGLDQIYQGEGAISLARPFLVAGAPLTVASLWPVDSSLTRDLMIRFHQFRKADQLPTAEALRRAQLKIIHAEPRFRHPYYWASFIVIGGYAAF